MLGGRRSGCLTDEFGWSNVRAILNNLGANTFIWWMAGNDGGGDGGGYSATVFFGFLPIWLVCHLVRVQGSSLLFSNWKLFFVIHSTVYLWPRWTGSFRTNPGPGLTVGNRYLVVVAVQELPQIVFFLRRVRDTPR